MHVLHDCKDQIDGMPNTLRGDIMSDQKLISTWLDMVNGRLVYGHGDLIGVDIPQDGITYYDNFSDLIADIKYNIHCMSELMEV